MSLASNNRDSSLNQATRSLWVTCLSAPWQFHSGIQTAGARLVMVAVERLPAGPRRDCGRWLPGTDKPLCISNWSRQVTWPSPSWTGQARVIFKTTSSQIPLPLVRMIILPKCKSSPASYTQTLHSVSPSMIPFRSNLWNTYYVGCRLRVVTLTTIMGFIVWTGRQSQPITQKCVLWRLW